MSVNNDELFSTLLKAIETEDTKAYETTLKNAKKVIKDMTRVSIEALDELKKEHDAEKTNTPTTENTDTADEKAVSGFDGKRFA